MHIVYPGKKGEIDEYFDRAVIKFARKTKWPMKVGKYNLSPNINGRQNGLTSIAKKNVMNSLLSEAQKMQDNVRGINHSPVWIGLTPDLHLTHMEFTGTIS